MSRPQFSQSLRGGPAIVNVLDMAPAVDGPSNRDTRSPDPHANEIVFVDAGIDDLATLLAGLEPGAEVIMLDSSSDAIGQIAAALAGRDSLAAIHIVADGAEGRIAFGAGSFGLGDLASHADDLATIGSALGADGDILLWSCDTGSGPVGQAFVDALAQATGADVAASTDPTGAAARGGDWVLELHSGAIEAGVPLTEDGVDGFDALLDDEPNGTDATLTTDEDTDYVFAVADFGFDDGAEDNDLVAVTITTLPGAGVLYLLGGVGGETPVTFGQSIAVTDIDAGLLVYRPGAEGSGLNYADFTFQVQDDGGSNDIDTTPNTISFNVDALNDTPTIAFTAYEPAASGETLVNTTTTGSQGNSAVAALSDDGHVVVWLGNGPGDSFGIFAQRYDASGAPSGGETLVNTTTANAQNAPAVAALSDGGYVVTWVDLAQDGSGRGVYAQRYDASGAAAGGEVRVNTFTTNDQDIPQVAGMSDGSYVIVWRSEIQDGSGDGVYLQRYDVAGTAIDGEQRVNTTTASDQTAPCVAALSGGGFVVIWSGNGAGDAGGVFMQRYDASGAMVGGETLVNTITSNGQTVPSIAALTDGGYVIAWQSADVSLSGIYAQRFDASGAAIGGEFAVNTTTGNEQTGPVVTALSDGGFVIAWEDDFNDPLGGVFAQRYDASGAAVGGEFLAHSTTANAQSAPSLAGLRGGDFIIAWNSQLQDGSSGGVYSQRFDANFVAVEGTGLDLKGGITLGDVDDNGGNYTLTISVGYGTLSIDPGTSGAGIDDSDPQAIVISGTLAQLQALLGSDPTSAVTYHTEDDTPPASTMLTVTFDDGGAITSGDTPLTIVAVNDAPELDLDFYTAGNDATLSWHSGDGPTAIAYGAFFTDDNASYDGATVTADFTANGASGDELTILSVGDGPGQIRIDSSDIYYEGTLVGSFTGGTGGSPLVATFNADACHCSIQMVIDSIAFDNASATPDTTDRTVTITLVDGGGTANGGHDTATADVILSVSAAANEAPEVMLVGPPGAVGGETLVNTITTDAQRFSSITALDDGGYVVAWSANGAGDDSGVFVQRYDAAGDPVGGETLVNTTTDFDQQVPSITALTDGGYIVTWFGYGLSDPDGIYTQRFDASGAPVGGETLVNTTTTQPQQNPSTAALSDGGYVVAWLSFEQDGSQGGIYAQRFDASGSPQGGETLVNTTTAQFQGDPSVAGLSGGGYVVTWTSQAQDSGGSQGVYAQRYDAAGVPQGDETLVNTTTALDQANSSVVGLVDGGYVVTWSGNGAGDDSGVFMQRYDASGVPVGGEVLVNTHTDNTQVSPSITALADGGFVVTWMSSHDDVVDSSIYAQRYDAAGVPVGGETLVNTTTIDGQELPTVAGLSDGSFVVAWFGNGQGDDVGVFTQRFDTEFAAVEQVPLDLKGSILLADVDDSGGTYTVTLSVTEGVLAIDAGTSGVSVDDSDAQNIILTGTLAEIQALLGSDPTSSVTYTYDDDFLPLAAIEFGVTIDDGTDIATDIVLIDLTPVNDAAELDLDFLSAGNDAVALYVSGDPATPISFNAAFDDDNANWDGATLTVAITGATADDQLTIDDTLTLDTTVVGSNIFYQGDLVGSFTGGANGDPLVVTFNADACACAIEEVTYAIAYANSGTVAALATRDVTFTFVDGGGTANGGNDTATATVELTVTPAPTPPVIDAGATANGNEDSAFALTGITITDAGDPATGLVTVHLGVEHGTLTIRTDVPGGIDATNIVNNASGRGITIVATPDQINATLAASGLSYLGDTNFNGADALTITANDGTPDTPLAISSLGAQPFFDFPSAAAFHDVDGDGFDDLILGLGDGSSSGGVLVLSGGIGGFGLPSGAADAFAFGDFDGDGTVDIGVASYAADGSGYVAYYSSLGGTLETIANVPYALDLIAGDFNGDGLMDLAAANSDSGNIAILLQTAPGAFAPPVYSSATALLTVSIRTGDFNGDGKLDLLASNFGDSTGFAPPGSVDLFLGNGDGSFGAATQVWTGPSNADGLVVADFNGDGYLDFAFASVDSVGVPGGVNGVQVVLGNGDGTFGTATGYVTTAGGSPHNIVAGDLNNDGIADLVVTNSDTPGTVSILIGNGDGSFQAPVDLDTGDLPYVVALGDPDDDGDLDLIVGSAGDGTYEAFNNDDFHRGTTAVKPIAVAGSAVAQADATSSAENAISTGNLFLDNGSGVDSDSDGDALVIALVNGSAANVGTTITLASGAKLTVNADGSYTYDPNGKFVTLTDGSSGAANTSATDSFTYTLAGGNTATVTITLNGVAGAGDRLQGDLAHDVINGTGGADFFIDTTGGNEDWTGLGGNDVFLFGATLTSADKVDGGAGADQIAIQGDYSTQLTLGTGIVGVEYMAILPGSDTRFGDPGTNSYDYNIKTVDQNVAAGVTFTVDANRLSAGEDFTFDGSAETDGKFFIWGGGGTDTLTGGTQNDTFYFGELGQFGASDTVDGGAGTDQLGLRGDYSIVFGAGQLTSIENIGMVSAFDTRFGALGSFFDYDLTMDDGNVLSGQQMTVDAAALRAGETLTFNGSAELDGSFRVFGGAGDDAITGSHGDDILVGWAGADTLTGGLGNDSFRYNLVSDSTAAAHDTIQDFTLGDTIDLSRIDAKPGVNGDQAFDFIGTTAFGHHAGELRYENVSGSTWMVQGDTDGDGTADFEIVVTVTDSHTFTGGDFVL